MSTKSSRLLSAVVLAGILSLVASSPVSAGPPETIPPFEIYLPLAPMASCEPYGLDFIILSETTFHGQGKVFKDEDGNPLRTEVHFKTDDLFVNASSGAQVSGHANYKESIDRETGDSTFRGLLWHVVVPGVGNVLQDAGLQIVSWDPFEIKVMNGTFQWNVGDFSEICAALD